MTDFIPEPKEEISSSPIDPNAAKIPEKNEDLEAKPFKISFAEYKEKECNIDSMDKENATCILKVIRDVGIYFTDQNNFSKNSSTRREIKHVVRDGDYTVLYNGLEEDQEVYEVKESHEKKGIDIRLFFFTIEDKKTFYILAAKANAHYDTTKSKNRKY